MGRVLGFSVQAGEKTILTFVLQKDEKQHPKLPEISLRKLLKIFGRWSYDHGMSQFFQNFDEQVKEMVVEVSIFLRFFF